MANIHIVVGTVMGTALVVAESLKASLESHGHHAKVSANFQPQAFLDDEIFLVCTSNTGMGDLPENILPFYAFITQQFPKLAGKPYGLVNLGDSSYPNFAQAGTLIADALDDLGATCLGEPLVMDAILVDDYAQEAKQWCDNWSTLLPD